MADHDRGGEVTLPGAGGGPGLTAPSARAANAGPVAEDDVTEWFGATTDGIGPEPPGPWWPGTRLTACTVAVGLAVGGLGAAAFRHYTRPSDASVAASRQAAVRAETAAWVSQQVSHGATVSCDQVMCAALTAHGFPGRSLTVLSPTSPAPDGSDVVIETPAVHSLFGSSLDAAWAPAALASFGAGADRITVRVIAPHGAAVYQVQLKTDLAARKRAGAALLRDPRVTVLPAAAGPLAAGLVDARLLAALTALARQQPISVAGFGNDGPGASPGIPLRVADLSEDDRSARRSTTDYVSSARAYLSSVRAAYQLTPVTTVASPHGPPLLRVQVTAPSPLR